MPDTGGEAYAQEAASNGKAVMPASPSGEAYYKQWEAALYKLLAWGLQLLLLYFSELQDAFLAISLVRRAVAFSLTPSCSATVLARLMPRSDNKVTFESLRYHVPSNAREVLVHAGMHSILPMSEWRGGVAPIGRILLQTTSQNSGKYQEAVAGALAAKLDAALLVVDDGLLKLIAVEVLGQRQQEGRGAGLVAWLLSFWLSGGKVALVWDVLHRVCTTLGPVVVLLKDVEKTVCGTQDSLHSFVQAFGSASKTPGRLPRKDKGQGHIVLLGGTSVSEPKEEQPITLRSLLEAIRDPSPRQGEREATQSFFPDFSSAFQEDVMPNAEKQVEQLFTTSVRLEPPSSGPAAERHQQQLAADALDLMAEGNLKVLEGMGLKRSKLPPVGSGVLRTRALTHTEWRKVYTWAKALEKATSAKSVVDFVSQLQIEAGASTASETGTSQSGDTRVAKSVQGEGNHAAALIAIDRNVEASKVVANPALGNKERLETKSDSVSEEALWYGLKMLERSGGGMKGSIKTENAYERRLLAEVVRPEDSGAGFSDVGALGKAKEALREVVQLPLQHPNLFAAGSLAKHSKGVLLFGPPGTGKTMLAKAVAAECGASFLAINPSAVASKWLGDGVKLVKAVFSLAAKMAPTVIFLDEVDALLSRRGSQGQEHSSVREMKLELMVQWDGIRSAGSAANDRVVVLGATNRPQDLDEAALRRFSRRIFCDLPDRKARQSILKVMLRRENLVENVDLGAVASRTDGYSGSDLNAVCTAAAMRPVRELLAATGKSAQIKADMWMQQRQEQQAASNSSISPDSQTTEGQSKPTRSSLSTPSSNAEPSRSPADLRAVAVSLQENPVFVEQPNDSATRPGEAMASSCGTPDTAVVPPGTDDATGVTSASPDTDTSDGNGSQVVSSPNSAAEASDRTNSPGSPHMQSSLTTSTASEESSQEVLEGELAVLEEKRKLDAAIESVKEAADKLNALLDDCKRIGQPDSAEHKDLRAISMLDFEEAIKQTAPSSDEYSHNMDDLRAWNAKYGEGQKDGGSHYNPKLSYFI